MPFSSHLFTSSADNNQVFSEDVIVETIALFLTAVHVKRVFGTFLMRYLRFNAVLLSLTKFYFIKVQVLKS